MRKRIIPLLLLSALVLLSGCESRNQATDSSSTAGSAATASVQTEESATEPQEDSVVSESAENQSTATIPQTGMTRPVPADYLTPASLQGTVVRMDYESRDYLRDNAPITKTAYIYLPYGYDENDLETRYDILYLMHGWGGQAGEYFTYNDGSIKNMFDHLIENGEMPPTIIVSATFYNENSDRNFGSSVNELREFHQDFLDYLMPAVEGQYHTYAASTSQEDLMASRDHRAFGGFSLGSVTTWMEFCYDSDYIRYYLPMSGSCWYFGGYGDYYPEETCDFFEELIAEHNLNERGYFIYAATGTDYNVRNQVEIQMQEMLARSDVFTPDHVVYYQKEGGQHNLEAVQEYLYNALPLFFVQ